MNRLKAGAIAFAGLAALCNIIGLATDYWVNADHDPVFGSVGVHSGLWRTCAQSSCSYYSQDSVTNKFAAARAFTIIPLPLIVPVVTLLVISMRKPGSMLSVFAAGLLFIQAVSLAIGAGVGVDYFKSERAQYDVDWSVGLVSAGAALYAIGGILAALSSRTDLSHRGFTALG